MCLKSTYKNYINTIYDTEISTKKISQWEARAKDVPCAEPFSDNDVNTTELMSQPLDPCKSLASLSDPHSFMSVPWCSNSILWWDSHFYSCVYINALCAPPVTVLFSLFHKQQHFTVNSPSDTVLVQNLHVQTRFFFNCFYALLSALYCVLRANTLSHVFHCVIRIYRYFIFP